MRNHTEEIAEAARSFVAAMKFYEATPMNTIDSARRAADLGRARESLIAAVDDEGGIPADQREDYNRFVGEGGSTGA